MKCYSALVVSKIANPEGGYPILLEIVKNDWQKAEKEAEAYIKKNNLNAEVYIEETTDKYM